MRTRKGWDHLSDAYRKRLIGAGVSRTDYDAGVGLQKVRGHGKGIKGPAEGGARVFQPKPRTGSRRRGWDTLSARYRKTLERKGVGRTQYEAGASLARVPKRDVVVARALGQGMASGKVDGFLGNHSVTQLWQICEWKTQAHEARLQGIGMLQPGFPPLPSWAVREYDRYDELFFYGF